MIIFKECKIDKEGKNILLNICVEDLPKYEDVYLESVIIDTEDTFKEDGPSDNPIYKVYLGSKGKSLEEIPGWGIIGNVPNKVKDAKLTISCDRLNLTTLKDHIFFIYVTSEGSDEIPYELAVTLDLKDIYNKSMYYIKELDNTCTIPKCFIDMILRIKAFKLSLKTGNFKEAVKQWKKLFKNKRNITVNNTCCGLN